MQLSCFAGELAEGGVQQNQCGEFITENIPQIQKKSRLSIPTWDPRPKLIDIHICYVFHAVEN